jgi:hypothetical protein
MKKDMPIAKTDKINPIIYFVEVSELLFEELEELLIIDNLLKLLLLDGIYLILYKIFI